MCSMLMQFITTSYTYVPYMDGQLDIRYYEFKISRQN